MSAIKAAVSSGSQKTGELAKLIQIPYPVASDDQLIIKAVAYAANPTDWKHIVLGWGPAGSVVGSDVSGIVEKIGKNVKGFEVGDYVSTTLHGNHLQERGAFADYVIVDPDTSLKFDKASFDEAQLAPGTYPPSPIKNFEGAAAINLSLATVALSFADSLKIPDDKKENADTFILIWGGATSTGIVAIQIAKLVYGLKVITTASAKNHEFLKSLGADVVLDYRNPDIVESIIKVAGGKIAYALDSVSSKETYQQMYDSTKGSKKVAFDNLLFLTEKDIKLDPERKSDTFGGTLVYLATGETQVLGDLVIEATPELIRSYKHFWYDLLPPHLAQLKTPALRVLPNGLQSTNEALELLRENKVSGEKVVFRA
ncbi:zinc-binding oxidoreductase alcohol dehydrogenase [Scheffersomyces xylosifermentans]|uniref:zinc-binding oxidoreductase alcohol dehydrogenase n=1 Tax=Scheffersomyces xylosifermentans TaxID=1304137 RepID=UPI00315D2012